MSHEARFDRLDLRCWWVSVNKAGGDQWRHLKKVQGRWGRSTLQSSSLLFSALILAFSFQGFSVEGQENLQEILSKQLLLCQFLMALSVVRTGDTLPSPHPGPTRGPVVQEHMLGLAWKLANGLLVWDDTWWNEDFRGESAMESPKSPLQLFPFCGLWLLMGPGIWALTLS